ncbi:hypothetical protein NBRC116592_11000 [Colwellia sp. KU-HH00111]|uniref:hypothetical protein n=1 Tax=Colwellia sp. KU-HH00111 TaxID=3127652 RepID=UPI003102CF68
MIFSITRNIVLLTALLSYINIAFATDIIRYVESQQFPDPKQGYFVDLLMLALEETTNEYGSYQLQPVHIEMTQARTSLMLERNEYVNLTWRMTSQALEQQLQAIYFPILKGLMGSRIFVINKGSQGKFPSNLPLSELKKIPLGQGINWPDATILLANGFNVVKGHDPYLVRMLKSGRFEFYPRALHEPWSELAEESELVVEKNFMLKYPAPTFFFVNKQNTRLHQRLDLGFKKLLSSGKFEQFFLNHPITAGILTKANVNQRIIFKLENPLLSNQVKQLLTDKRLWLTAK